MSMFSKDNPSLTLPHGPSPTPSPTPPSTEADNISVPSPRVSSIRIKSDKSDGGHEDKLPRKARRNSRRRVSLERQLTVAPWKTRLQWRLQRIEMLDDHAQQQQAGPPAGTGTIQRLRNKVGLMLASTWYETLISIIITVNAVTIGLSQSLSLLSPEPEGWLQVLQTLEHIFLAGYVMELLATMFGKGRSCWKNAWFRFNCFLVVVGVIVTWLLEPLLGNEAKSANNLLMVMRTLRLLRLVRTVRLLIRFKELWMLVHGLMNSASTMIYTLVMLVVILYIFSSIGIEIVTHNPRLADDPIADELVQRYFKNLPQIMLTLVQFFCLDSIHMIYKPLIETDPSLAIYFITVILVVAVVVMNLVTAVIVNGAFEQARKDQELLKHSEAIQRERMVKDLRKMFQRLDADQSGELSRDELMNISKEDRKVLSAATTISDPLEIFFALDVDDRGALDIDEFCEGVWQVLVSQSPIEIKRMEKQMNFLRRDVSNIRHTQAELLESLQYLRTCMDLPSQGLISTITHSQAHFFKNQVSKSSVSPSEDGSSKVTSRDHSGMDADSSAEDHPLFRASVPSWPAMEPCGVPDWEDSLKALFEELEGRFEATRKMLNQCSDASTDLFVQAYSDLKQMQAESQSLDVHRSTSRERVDLPVTPSASTPVRQQTPSGLKNSPLRSTPDGSQKAGAGAAIDTRMVVFGTPECRRTSPTICGQKLRLGAGSATRAPQRLERRGRSAKRMTRATL